MRTLLPLVLTGCVCSTPAPEGPEAPATVVLVVLDTLRADHVGACGGPAGLTPTLDALAARPDAALSCAGWSSGTWTHPSHASLFTGQPVEVHGALWAAEGGTPINPVTRVHPLPGAASTLAERFGAAGWTTAIVSANPILTRASGLLQGFDHVEVAPSGQTFRGDGLARPLFSVFGRVEPDAPLLLVVNVYDAHDPWPEVPPGRPWAEPQPALDLEPNTDADTPYRRFLRGELPEDEAAAYRTAVRAGYAEGVHAADAGLDLILTMLDRYRDADGPRRLLVTSDHGELLGEHGLLRHGGFLWEPAIRIPAVWVETGAAPRLPDRFALHALHDLLWRGEPAEVAPVSASEPNPDDLRVGHLGVAAWTADAKRVATPERTVRYDLSTDPGEQHPVPDDDPDLVRRLHALRTAWAAEGEPVTEALQAVGYTE